MNPGSLLGRVPGVEPRYLGDGEQALAALDVALLPLMGGHEVASRQIAERRGIRLAGSMRLVATSYRVAVLADAVLLNSVPYAEVTMFEVSRDGLRTLVLMGIRGVPIHLRSRRTPSREFAATLTRLRAS